MYSQFDIDLWRRFYRNTQEQGLSVAYPSACHRIKSFKVPVIIHKSPEIPSFLDGSILYDIYMDKALPEDLMEDFKWTV